MADFRSVGKRMVSACFSALAGIGILWVLITVTPAVKWWADLLAGPWDQPRGDVLILMGADEPGYGFIGQWSYWRSVYAVRAWREGGFRTIVVTGGNGIAESMKEFLCFNGVPAASVIVEDRAMSTHENAVFSARILAHLPGRKVVITSDFHVYRSVRAFRRAGVDVASWPIPYANKLGNIWSERTSLFFQLCLETAKILDYRARGWI